jgi:two-component system sensor histidine kinase GlrK
LQDEGALHRAAWRLDVEMRHSQLACANGEVTSDVSPRIARAAQALARTVQGSSAVPNRLRELVDGYLSLAATVRDETCVKLLDPRLQSRRAQLDEQLTNVWVARLEELHRAVRDKDEEASRLARVSTWVGIPLALAACLGALWVAGRMASTVKEPLARLARMAKGVGRGDFQTQVYVRGPAEVVALADELEHMRHQLQQLEALKQGFLASVSHELRTPLSKIREALALLQDGAVGALEERQLRVVQIARTACEREIRMVTTLLDLSRLRAGSPIQLREHCAIDTVIQSALSDERLDAAARGVNLEVDLPGETPPVQLDPVLMERAVANLVRNAVSVSRASQRVHVHRKLEQDGPGRPGAWICISVSDEGPGVPQEIRERVFDAFVTGVVPGAGRALGVGIGLALAREVARAHGGDLMLCETERGARFELWFPLTRPQLATQAPATLTLGIEGVSS